MEKWEPITSKEQESPYSSYTERLKVFGGWIVRSTDANHRNQCMVFILDESHDWVIEPDIEPEVETPEETEKRGALGGYRQQ